MFLKEFIDEINITKKWFFKFIFGDSRKSAFIYFIIFGFLKALIKEDLVIICELKYITYLFLYSIQMRPVRPQARKSGNALNIGLVDQ
jgi:hypothetical protein